MLELAEVIWRKIKGPDVPLRFVPTTRSSTTCSAACRRPRRRSDVLGFEATTTLDEMLDEVIPWISESVAAGRI